METAGIDDMIVNSIALTFILDIDELCLQTFTTPYMKGVLTRCRDLPLSDFKSELEREWLTDGETHVSEMLALHRLGDNQLQKRFSLLDTIYAIFPFRFLGVLATASFFVFSYYLGHCNNSEAGFLRYWPKPLFLAESTKYSVLNSFFPRFFPVVSNGDPIWSMPNQTRSV
mmetsp:Transcript_88382/g.156723  ORF Transcript_88382/g.156723 Transcript_88382/m.156723 type:complete len:171 (-) Transcript_88382:40-552(-)